MSKNLNKNFLDFLDKVNISNKNICTLKSDASNRTYYRDLSKKNNFLIMDSSLEKNSLKNFINISKWLKSKNYSVPEIYFKNLSKGFCVIEDFGDNKFSNLKPLNMQEKYRLTIRLLVSLSKLKPPKFLKSYSKIIFMKELNLFLNWYLFYNKTKNKHALLEWQNIWKKLFLNIIRFNYKSLVLRDFHIDNLFWLEKKANIQKVGLIDFQDALIGHPCYDLVSLLQDVRNNISNKDQHSLYNYYISISNLEKKSFEEAYFIFGTQRLIKIIGIFYRLKYLNKKENYIKYIPRTWFLLKRNLKFGPLNELSNWFKRYVFK
ncbi:MAG: hypothetical protein CFH34_00275 [Alphaproteobacteria bacterium MarineAlpha9_Bin4]|nr:MAG: hypothetical protein CFH34_00275 [Alphaproteobacteria bacterium MarineAlpha9_Bin4]